MNKDQRKFAVRTIEMARDRKANAIAAERDRAKQELVDTSHPAKLYIAELAKNEKERKVLADRLTAELQRFRDFCAYDPHVSISLIWDTRKDPADGVETPMMKKIKKAFYDEQDRLSASCAARLEKLNARANALIAQIWLCDLPQALADMLKAFEAEEF